MKPWPPAGGSPPSGRRSGQGWMAGWIWTGVVFSAAGWLLAASGGLNRAAYGVLGVLLLAGLGWGIQRGTLRRPWFRRHRWQRALPRLFLLLLGASCLGGMIAPPNNYDALTYRLPQILHWLAEGRWHWIATSELQMNAACAGQGWLLAPWIEWFRNDRGFFLPSLISLALLPGAFFSILRRCGVAGRVAWAWMWLLPFASCYALQAGGLGNDLLATTYWLAALALGLKARATGCGRSLLLSALAAALATGVKITGLPLILPWLLVVLPCWKVALRTGRTVPALILALLVSAAPTLTLNFIHTGDLGGDPGDTLKVRVADPAAGLAGNAVILAGGAVAPPIFPGAASANRLLAELENSPVGQWIRRSFPRFNPEWWDLANEENAGFGLALTVLAAASLLAARRPAFRPTGRQDALARIILLGTAIATLVFFGRVGSEAAARLAAPFYPLLLIPILRRASAAWYRGRWFCWLSLGATLSTLFAVILTPAHPLWPAESILDQAGRRNPENAALQRAALVYRTYRDRHDFLAPLKAAIPAGARLIGFVPTINDLEAPLWKPYGRWKVAEVRVPDRQHPSVAALRGSVIFTSVRGLQDRFQLTPPEFAAAIGGRIVARQMVTQKARLGPEEWLVIAVE